MKHESKLTQQEKEELAAKQQQMQSAAASEFASVEEMLRHDALRTPVPPSIAYRLEQSIRQMPAPPARPWWRRFFGR